MKTASADTYAYSTDEENYHGIFDSPEEAAAEAFAEDDSLQSVWVGRRVTPDRVPDADSLIDQVGESTTEEAGDWANDYLCGIPRDVRRELQDELQALWDRWEKKHGLEPTWFNVTDATQHFREP